MKDETVNKMDRFFNKSIEQQTILEIYRACRLCGAGGGYKMPIIQNVLNLDGCDVELKQKIRECVQIEVRQDDKMPPLICELCVDKVNDFYEFLEMCRQTNKRTRMRLGLPPQMLPKDGQDASDCILGVTEPIYVNNEDTAAAQSDKKAKSKAVKLKREPEPPKKEVRIKLESIAPERTSRSSRHRAPSPLRLRDKRRSSGDDVSLSKLQTKMKKSLSPAPKSILKKGKETKFQREPTPPPSRLKRSRDAPAQEVPAKKVKIAVKSPPPKPQPSSRLREKEREKRRESQKLERGRQKEERERQKESKEQQTPCEVCNAVFKTPQAASSHKRCHVVTFTNPKQACNACEMWFASADETAAHHKRHRRQGLPYCCNRCSSAYRTLEGYDGHVSEGACEPWAEVPDVRCDECWRHYPTMTLLDAHRCAGAHARPGGACKKCGKSYALLKTLTKHESTCKKGDLIVEPGVLDRLRPVRVRVARCDPLLAAARGRHYDVAAVPGNYGLDEKCIYPYMSSGLRIKTEESDCMVKINEMDFGSYVHWDSEDDSGDSDAELDLTSFERKRKVKTLASCALKTIFSERFLGKVPKKNRRVKIEKIINSALNDSLSELNLNDSIEVGKSACSVVSDKRDSDQVTSVSYDDDDLFPVKCNQKRITNDDFDSLFESTELVVNDKLVGDGDRIKNLDDCNDLVNGAKDSLEKNDHGLDVNDKIMNSTESTNKEIEKDKVISNSSDGNVNVNSEEERISSKIDLNPNPNEIKEISQEASNSDDSKTIVASETDISTENVTSTDDDNSHTQSNDQESNNTADILERQEAKADKPETEEFVKNNEHMKIYSETNINEASSVETNTDIIENTTESPKKETESSVVEDKIEKSKVQVNGESYVDDNTSLNMDDLKDFNESEFDDANLMAELDAQIGENKETATIFEKEMISEESKDLCEAESGCNTEDTSVKEIETSREDKNSDLAKYDTMSLDLDSISDGELEDFTD